MRQEELVQYVCTETVERFWEYDGHKWKGNSLAALADRAGWEFLPVWGKSWHEVGAYPYEMFFLKDEAGKFFIAHYDSVEMVIYQASSQEERNTIMDTLAFLNWQERGMPWVYGLTSVEQMHDACKGPYNARWGRKDEKHNAAQSC